MVKRNEFKWIDLLVGIIFVLISIYTFRNPGLSLSGFVVTYGILAVISGVADISFYVRLERHTGFGPVVALVAGILNILLGFFLIMNSEIGAFAVAILFPIWFIAHCIGQLTNIGLIRLCGSEAQYWVTLIVNVLGLILGIMLLFNPFASAVSMVYIAGLYLLFVGIGHIISAFLF